MSLLVNQNRSFLFSLNLIYIKWVECFGSKFLLIILYKAQERLKQADFDWNLWTSVYWNGRVTGHFIDLRKTFNDPGIGIGYYYRLSCGHFYKKYHPLIKMNERKRKITGKNTGSKPSPKLFFGRQTAFQRRQFFNIES